GFGCGAPRYASPTPGDEVEALLRVGHGDPPVGELVGHAVLALGDVADDLGILGEVDVVAFLLLEPAVVLEVGLQLGRLLGRHGRPAVHLRDVGAVLVVAPHALHAALQLVLADAEGILPRAPAEIGQLGDERRPENRLARQLLGGRLGGLRGVVAGRAGREGEGGGAGEARDRDAASERHVRLPSTSRTASWIRPLVASADSESSVSRPSKDVKRPPASRTIAAAAATSYSFTSNSPTISRRPSASSMYAQTSP